jgi:uncharacterized membrane protein YqhA
VTKRSGKIKKQGPPLEPWSKKLRALGDCLGRFSETLIYGGRVGLYVVGIFFILFGFGVFGYSWYDPVYKFAIATVKEPLIFFMKVAEYYLISATFTIVGRSLCFIGGFRAPEEIDVDMLKEHLFAMVVSISGVAFISILLQQTLEMGINILWVGLGIAVVATSLAGYVFLTRKREQKENEGIPPEPKKPEEELPVAELPQEPEEEKT